MKYRIKKFIDKETAIVDGNEYTVMVYGELSESNYLTGYAPVYFTRKGRIVKYCGDPVIVDDKYRSPKKIFNMGWSICSHNDEFSENIGIKWAKKRFAKSPLTTQNGNFLTPDMCQAIVKNEAKYISDNINKYVKGNK